MKKVVLLVFISLAVAIGITELCCRLGLVSSGFYRASILRKQPRRVLVLGDSFINDQGELNRLLEDYFSAQGVAMLNLAKGGMRPVDYLKVLRLYGDLFAPQTVLLNYAVATDLTDTRYRTMPAEFEAAMGEEGGTRLFITGVFRERYRAWRERRWLADAKERVLREHPEVRHAANPFLGLGGARPEWIMNNVALNDHESRAAWEKNQKIILRISDWCKERNVRLLVHIFPATAQVNRSHHPFLSGLGYHLGPKILKESIAQDLFLKFCRTNGLDCYDLLPEFRKSSAREFYIANDDHWNSAGNRFAGTLIIRRLKAAGVDR